MLTPVTVSHHFEKGYINLSEQQGYELAPITTNRGAEMRSEIRNNSRVILDNLELANNLWRRIAEYVPQEINIPLGINSDLIEKWSPGFKDLVQIEAIKQKLRDRIHSKILVIKLFSDRFAFLLLR